MRNQLIMIILCKEQFLGEDGQSMEDAWSAHVRRYDQFGAVENGHAAYMESKADAIHVVEFAL